MRTVKRAICVCLLGIILCTFGFGSAFAAQSELSVSVKGGEAYSGTTFTVDVSIDENPGVAALRLSVVYDKNVLTLVKVTDGGMFEDVETGKQYMSPYKCVWINGDGAENVTATGKLMTLTFKAKEVTEETSTEISLKLESGNDCLNSALGSVAVSTKLGAVKIVPKSGVKGDVDNNGAFDSDDAVYFAKLFTDGDTLPELNQAVDFNGDGKVDRDDAVYLLYNTLFGDEEYPLK